MPAEMFLSPCNMLSIACFTPASPLLTEPAAALEAAAETAWHVSMACWNVCVPAAIAFSASLMVSRACAISCWSSLAADEIVCATSASADCSALCSRLQKLACRSCLSFPPLPFFRRMLIDLLQTHFSRGGRKEHASGVARPRGNQQTLEAAIHVAL